MYALHGGLQQYRVCCVRVMNTNFSISRPINPPKSICEVFNCNIIVYIRTVIVWEMRGYRRDDKFLSK
jgi:hypothetical protein